MKLSQGVDKDFDYNHPNLPNHEDATSKEEDNSHLKRTQQVSEWDTEAHDHNIQYLPKHEDKNLRTIGKAHDNKIFKS